MPIRIASLSKIKHFGRLIFDYYEKYPLLMNSLAGGYVFLASELVVQVQSQRENRKSSGSSSSISSNNNIGSSSNGGLAGFREASTLFLRECYAYFQGIDWRRVGQIALLGTIENGIFMLAWYRLLNRFVGDQIRTGIVLTKCVLDQAFFATQQDGIFLALCAYQSAESYNEALAEVKRTFLTTWINDCSVWPLVNFVGFAFVPLTLQPTYMSTVQFFWQIYISSVASTGGSFGNSNQESEQDHYLAQMFAEIDCDGNGFIDAEELETALWKRSIHVSRAEIQRMVTEASRVDRGEGEGEGVGEGEGRDGGNHASDDLVSFHQFKAIAHASISLSDSSSERAMDEGVARLWRKVATRPKTLEKGAKAVLSRMQEANKKGAEAAAAQKEQAAYAQSTRSVDLKQPGALDAAVAAAMASAGSESSHNSTSVGAVSTRGGASATSSDNCSTNNTRSSTSSSSDSTNSSSSSKIAPARGSTLILTMTRMTSPEDLDVNTQSIKSGRTALKDYAQKAHDEYVEYIKNTAARRVAAEQIAARKAAMGMGAGTGSKVGTSSGSGEGFILSPTSVLAGSVGMGGVGTGSVDGFDDHARGSSGRTDSVTGSGAGYGSGSGMGTSRGSGSGSTRSGLLQPATVDVYHPCDPLFYRQRVEREGRHRSDDEYERHVARLLRRSATTATCGPSARVWSARSPSSSCSRQTRRGGGATSGDGPSTMSWCASGRTTCSPRCARTPWSTRGSAARSWWQRRWCGNLFSRFNPHRLAYLLLADP